MFQFMRTYFRLLAEDREKGDLSKVIYPLLDVLSWLYGGIVALLRNLYDRKVFKRQRLPFPVISVGNLTWGGTGKTPLVEYLAIKVSEQRRTPLILTRGYGHDEVEQFRNHLPNAVLGVGKDRASVGKKIIKGRRIDVGILDDGLQHWKVERDVEIIVVNAINPFGNRKLIPRGILREPLSVLKKATIVVLTYVNLASPKEVHHLTRMIQKFAPKAFIVESALEPLFFYRADRRKKVSLDRLQNHRVATFSGVATPRSFQMLLSQCQIRPTRNFEFTDHHVFTQEELEEIKGVSESSAVDEIVTTEKDFFRSPEVITRILNPLVLATRVRILSGEEILTDRLFRLLGVTR
ncbi:MAG: tetraacyldisaccharide 4'-kinase [Candidatus Omnitrophica bacterium]|nr:tetraacyldisaccharide 4'-kinase [Candidatus Omnitrophota bacterium]MDD5671329.1 tetraacyldisaccharide 4'-kinase [Candidatus Omnitrophota bacterium]